MNNRLLRWLLQLDRPAPELTPEELEGLVRRDFRRNAGANMVDGLTFWLGLSLISSTTIVPLFISKLTSSTLPIGLVAMVSQGGWYLPQILTANWIERLPRRKPAVTRLGLFAERIPVWVMVLAAALAVHSASLALGLFLGAFVWRSLAGGALGPAWQDMIARVIPVERRGRFWGLTSSAGVGLGVLGSVLSAWLLRSLPFSTSFVCIFALAAAVMSLGWAFLTLTREPAQPVTAPRRSQRQFLSSVPELLRLDRPFRRFLVARMMLALGAVGSGFLTVSAIRRWAVSDATVGLYTAALLLGQTAGNLLFGLLADRRGHKQSLEWSALAYAAAFALAWLAPSPAWFYAVFALLGIAGGAVIVSGIMVLLEFCAPERRPTYAGIANTATGAVAMAGPLLATVLAGIRLEWVFVVSTAASMAAWAAMRWGVQEPRWAEARSASHEVELQD